MACNNMKYLAAKINIFILIVILSVVTPIQPQPLSRDTHTVTTPVMLHPYSPPALLTWQGLMESV